MIPKKIHYIWLGKNPYPNLMDICINSWREKLPDYEIIEWNEENLNFYEEIKKNRFLKECYERKLWAFLSDYFRIKVLYEHGGVYLDTDMQIVKNIDNLLLNKFFIGAESEGTISAGIIGVIPKHSLINKILKFYEQDIWSEPIFTIPDIITRVVKREYEFQQKRDIIEIDKGMIIYPPRYFYPYYFTENFKYSCIKEDTYGIHWWGKSWGQKKDLSKLYFLEFKHYRGVKKLLVELLISMKLMKFVKQSKLLIELSKRI
ncbi:glycosyltransferase [Fusobacterium mortiferum]|uniref:glycosyltransferase n=1 Tax=Fusobacterium mortiferum TaxID=850 RepID=UPI001958A0C4|nr:glycosyltransferase [Fusobacterium mortiferum]